jgi:hypothetical protein
MAKYQAPLHASTGPYVAGHFCCPVIMTAGQARGYTANRRTMRECLGPLFRLRAQAVVRLRQPTAWIPRRAVSWS